MGLDRLWLRGQSSGEQEGMESITAYAHVGVAYKAAFSVKINKDREAGGGQIIK